MKISEINRIKEQRENQQINLELKNQKLKLEIEILKHTLKKLKGEK